ncbi:MAG: BMC domain-containing protein [Candidatus Wallbacteria bacterium]|nr:BMC domain-containing protein [Candidatus Wallbacteria bacterium]
MDVSLGLLESTCLTGAVEVLDFILKKVSVTAGFREYPGNGLVTVAFTGTTADVREAVDSGSEHLKRFGCYHSSTQILNPAPGLLAAFGLKEKVPMQPPNRINSKPRAEKQPESKISEQTKKTEIPQSIQESLPLPEPKIPVKPHCNFICSLCNDLTCTERWQ